MQRGDVKVNLFSGPPTAVMLRIVDCSGGVAAVCGVDIASVFRELRVAVVVVLQLMIS